MATERLRAAGARWAVGAVGAVVLNADAQGAGREEVDFDSVTDT